MYLERGVRAVLTAGLALAAACDRGHQEKRASGLGPRASAQSSEAAAPARTATGCTLAAVPLRVPPPKRLVAIGDLHGDLGGARAALRAAGAIDDHDKWIGGDLVVVQTGDVLDRGDDESKILELLERLAGEAHAAGGTVIQLVGNHELMNAAGDFRYVTPGGARDFGGERAAALAPGGVWAKKLAAHNVIAIVGDSVLSHAGVLASWAGRVEDTNLAARCWLDGQSGDAKHPTEALASDDSPVWTRVYGTEGAVDCKELDGVLATLGAKRMIVAHTVQEHGITSACDEKLWRIDVGLAKLYGGPIEVLEIVGEKARVVRGTR
jgi:hypothetical protein